MKLTRDELQLKFPNASAAFLRANSASGERAEARPQLQEQKTHVREATGYGARDGQMDVGRSGRFRVSITLLLSDKRDRDPDGAAATLMDCILDSLGRLGGVDRRTLRKLAKREERR